MARCRLVAGLLPSVVAIVLLTGCGLFRAGAPVAARQFATEALAARQVVHAAVQELDAAAANRALTGLRGISDDAAAVSRQAGTAEARTASRQVANARRQAELEVRTGWMDEVAQYGREKVKEQLRKAVRRAACDVAHEILENRVEPDLRQHAARVALYLNNRLGDASTVEQVTAAVLDDFNLLVGLDPADEYDRESIIYLAEAVFCPDAVAALAPQQFGWGFNLLGTPVTVVDSNNQAVGQLSPNAIVRVTCTLRWFEVQGPYGTTSDLWDFVGPGLVPDAYLYTGTNEPVAGPC